MQINKEIFSYDSRCIIDCLKEDFTTENNYTVVYSLDTSRHPSFVLQLINKGNTNALTYKIETTFDGIYLKEIATGDINANSNVVIEDESIGTRTLISIKSKVSNSHTTFNMWTKLKPASFII